MDFKTINQFWGLVDPLTVRQAAALIAGVDPNSVDDSGEWFKDSETGLTDGDGIAWVKTALAALENAVNAGKLKATIRRNARMQAWDEWPNHGEALREFGDDDGRIRDGSEPAVIYCEALDWGKTTVEVVDLRAWLESNGIRTGFFFPTAADTPDYLDPKNLRYAPKLAASVRAWLAVTDTGKTSPKRALAKWLREHAAEFGLSDDEGKPNETGIEEVAKVANWQLGGGAPKT